MKRSLFFVTMFILLFGASANTQTWVQQTSGTTTNLLSIHFINENVGWASGGNGVILKTTNGGNNWTQLPVAPPIGTNWLETIVFLDANVGFTANSFIYKTTDGGNSWTTVSTNTSALRSIYFPNSITGYAVGYGNTILKTTNGGNSWFTLTSGYTTNLRTVYFLNSDIGFVAGDAEYILKTTNGGTTWSQINITGGIGAIYGIRFSDATTGYTASTGGQPYKTTDGGTSWNKLASLVSGGLYCVFPVDANTAYWGSSGIYQTTNGGTSWTNQLSLSASIGIWKIWFPTPAVGYAIGSNGLIYKYTGGTSSSSITVTSPNGGENWIAGTVHPITWTSINVSNVMLEYSTNNGNSWNGIVVSYPAAGGTYSWSVPNSLSTQCKVRVSDATNPTIMDQSDNVFAISSSSGATGLIAYYPFNGNTNDESGNGRHGVNFGATLTTDRFGQANKAYSFNGTSNYINIPGTNALHLTTGFTVCAWVSFAEASNNHAIISKHISGYGNGYYLQIRPATRPEFYISSEPGLQAPDPINDGQWHFIVGNYDGTTMKLYVDGVLKLSQSKTYNSTNDSTIMIGKHHQGVSAEWFNGKIDDIKIYDKALTAAEITQLYTEGSSLNSGLIAYYPFNGNVNDASGNGRHGVNYGATITIDRFGNPNRAYSFNGTSSYINIPGTNSLHLTSGFALCAWTNFIDASNVLAIVSKHIAGYGNGYYLQIRPATRPEFFLSSEPGLQASDPINNGQWHFIVGNYDGTAMKLYVDGVLKLSQSKTYNSTNDSTIMIGRHHLGAAADWFNGKIDDIRIYNRPLTEIEIAVLDNEIPLGSHDHSSETPIAFELEQNYPNPFNPSTTIEYSIPQQSHVALKVFDLLGREVAVLVNEVRQAGRYSVQWDAARMPSGMYFYRLSAVPLARRDLVPTVGRNEQAGSYQEIKRMLMIK